MYGQSFEVSDAVMKDDFVLPIGKAKIEKPGNDCTLVAHSIGVGKALDAAKELEKQGTLPVIFNLKESIVKLSTFVQFVPWISTPSSQVSRKQTES
jgi:pyruvate/2-oxoglutarate/acetoin dehydrogenase E1 component